MKFPTNEVELRAWIEAGVEESLTVEYKRSAALSRESSQRSEILKDVSAMANSAGGVLIYGVAEFSKGSGKEHLPAGIDPVNDPKLSKEWLEQLINSGIRPRIIDVEIIPIRISGPVGTVFVVNIPEGATAHQADDRKYYRRFNFVNEPMYDHEIRDVMGRAKHPIVKVTTHVTVGKSEDLIGRKSSELYRWLEFGLHNEGSRMARYVTAFVSFPYEWLVSPKNEYGVSVHEIENMLYAQITLSNRSAEGKGAISRPIKIDEPLLPGLSLKLKTFCLVGPPQQLSLGGKVVVRIYADEAPPRTDILLVA